MSNIINIKDFNLFLDMVKTSTKLVESAKFIFSSSGVELYGAISTIARCELTSNSVSSNEEFSISIKDLAAFNKVLNTVKEVHDNDYASLKISYSQPFIKFESKKIKTKFSTINENTIENWISKKVTTAMESVFDFTTTSDMIKKINSHSFMFSDSKNVRVYLETKDDMEVNNVYATLGNRNIENSNELTLKCGLVTFGKIPDDKNIILDLERFNLFNAITSNDIKISLMNYNCLMYKTHITGKNNSEFNMTIYCTKLKS